MSDSIDALLAELDRLPRRSRAAILDALHPGELAQLRRRSSNVGDDDAADAAPFSPWLAARIAQSRNPAALTPPSERMTAAARDILLACITVSPPERQETTRVAEFGGRSLADAVGGLLSSRGARS